MRIQILLGSFVPEREMALATEQIRAYLNLGLSVSAIRILTNPLLEKPATYNTFKYFVQRLPKSVPA